MSEINFIGRNLTKKLIIRLRIEGALMIGVSINQISKVFGVDKRTVSNVKKVGVLHRKNRSDIGRTIILE